MRTTVALVGRCLPDNENLGLGYLQTALNQAQLGCLRLVLNDVRELEEVLTSILQSGATLVGLSLPDGGSALAPLALGEALRARGYTGHVTCGGPFATLAREWLLERYGWLDSVVRFAGEVPLVALARALACGGKAEQVAGITTRAGDGPPAPVCDLPLDLVPTRERLPSILGWGAAHILATRGCEGRCLYCGPAALQQQELGEGRRGGKNQGQLRALGIGGVRRRTVEAVCDEIAALYQEHSTRYFYFADEHLLPYEESAALKWIESLGAGLERRRLGRIGLGTMLRADRITPPIVEHFARVGLVRLFLGVEFGSEEAARKYGRHFDRDHVFRVLSALREQRVAVVSNIMIVHPWATEQTLEADIDLLSTAPGGVFEATRMMVYHGTRLGDRLREQGRLIGNPLRYGYLFDNPVVARFADIYTRLRAESFWDHSIAYRTHDTWLAARLSQHLGEGGSDPTVARELEALRGEINRLYASSLRVALSLAQAGGGAWECGPLVSSARQQSLALLRRLEHCVERIPGVNGSRLPLFSPLRAAAASALVFSMLGSSSAACGGKTELAPETVAQNDGSVPEAGKDSTLPQDAKSEVLDAKTDVVDAAVDVVDAKPDILVSCTPNELEAERQNVMQAVLQNVPCFSGSVLYAQGSMTLSFYPGYSGMQSFLPCLNDPGNKAKTDAWTATAKTAAEGAFAPCLLKQANDYVQIKGGVSQEQETMSNAVSAACGNLNYAQFLIVVDSSGTVVEVKPQSGAIVPPQILSCVQAALSGLTFPCYAGMTVCPEYAIAE